MLNLSRGIADLIVWQIYLLLPCHPSNITFLLFQRNPEITHMLNNPELMRQVGESSICMC